MNNTAPHRTRQISLGFYRPEPEHFAPGRVVRVLSQPLVVDFTPGRLVLPHDVAAAFRVEDVQVLGVSLFSLGSLPIAGREFAPDVTKHRLLAPVRARCGVCVELHVLNTSGSPHGFGAAIVGTVG